MAIAKRTRGSALAVCLAVGLSMTGVVAPSTAAASGSAGPPVRAKPAGPLSVRLQALAAASAGGASPSAAAQDSAVGLPARGPASLLHSRDGRLIVEVRTADTSAATIARLRRVGAVVNVAKRWRTTTLAIAPTRLTALARITGVQSAMESLAPVTNSVAANPTPAAAASGACGSVHSEADAQLRANVARNHDFVDGSGQTVGILSNSFDAQHAAADVASGDLPGPGNPCGRLTPVKVLADDTPGADEGRAMAQLVHDIAPGAAIDFATADEGTMDFASNIGALKAAGANVLVDDYTYFAEPFFQDGPVAVAVNDATADGHTNYFSSAGNFNVVAGGHDVGSYEAAKYRPTACPPAVAAYGAGEHDCHDFDPGPGVSNGDTLSLGGFNELKLDFQYAEPWFGVTDDFDVFLVDASSGAVVAASTDDNQVTQQPFEFVDIYHFDSTDVRVVIARHSGRGRPRLKFSLLGSRGIDAAQFATSSGPDVIGPTIFGHNGAANAVSVAAVPATSTTDPETYSSRGPVTMVYGPVDGTTAAPPLPRVVRLAKPDLAATDCVATTFFSSGVFCGTSAAAPNAAAVAALMRQRNPKARAKLIVNKLKATAAPMENGTPQSVGSGLVDAAAAVTAVGGKPQYAKFTDAGMDYPLAITAGPDGALWVGSYGGEITRVTTSGAITNFPDARIGYTDGIATGADGNIWFTNKLANQIGRITPAGVVTIFTDATLSGPSSITSRPDGALWFVNATYPNYSVGRIATDGTITRFTDPSINGPGQITTGPDGNLWFTNLGPPRSASVGSIGRITTAGVVTSYTADGKVYQPVGIAVGGDGALWFTQGDAPGRIGRITTAGEISYIYDPSILTAGQMASGPDGAVWFTDGGGPSLGDESVDRLSMNGVATRFTDPSLERPSGIVTGPDGNVWTANFDSKTIGRFTASFRRVSVVMHPTMNTPFGITNGPGGVLWFTNRDGSSISRVSTAGVVTNFTDPTISGPTGIVAGPDNALWFTNSGNHSIGRITWKGAVKSYTVPDIGTPQSIAAGPDGALWFTTLGDGVGRVTTAGHITMYHDAAIARSYDITTGPDGALWFTDLGPLTTGIGAVARITTDGTITRFSDPVMRRPFGITAGPDGALWYADIGGNSIGRITTDGTVTNFTASGLSSPRMITVGPDGALWFTIDADLGRMTTAGSFSSPLTVGFGGPQAQAQDLTTGPDGQLWFTGLDNVVGHVNLVDYF
ncbi:MAG TPA: S8 family serine peptidase [Acidimicrobiia bacterium]|nr:S8 family serine peptidase [Acidimicrobiia bacterium]